MRIGELSERTGTPRRLLRYYEEQGLITPRRCANGYRDYSEEFPDRILQYSTGKARRHQTSGC